MGQGNYNFFIKDMMESMVDYVLERGNQHYGEFSSKGKNEANSVLFNHRKLLEYLFQDNQASAFLLDNRKRISDLKCEEISGQFNFLSQKIHAELNKKHLGIDQDLYKLENNWLKKKIPNFYSYYFLKFAYANTYTQMHKLFISEIQKMAQEKDPYSIVRKTIDAREICLANLRKQIASLTEEEIEESLESLRVELEQKKKKSLENDQKGFKKKNNKEEEEPNKSWKNKLQVVFDIMSHLRKLTGFVVELIKNWKNTVYEMSDDPGRFRQRVIFFHTDANYLIKMIFDNKFVSESELKDYLTFGNHYDPFFLKPAMALENKKSRLSDDEEIFLSLIKPTDLEMTRMTKALVILAEEEYDEDEQSRFLNERKNFGELEHRKNFIERRRNILNSKSTVNIQKESNKESDSERKTQIFSTDKKSDNTQKELQQVRMEKQQIERKSRIQSSLNRVKNIRSLDLKKVSPYIGRTEKISKAQRVIEIEHKFRMAQEEYMDSAIKKKRKDGEGKDKKFEVKKDWNSSQQQILNNRVFNRYIEENLKIIEEANKKSIGGKNSKANLRKQMSVKEINKQIEYEREIQLLEKGGRTKSREKSPTVKNIGNRNYASKGTKAIIEISGKGVHSNENAVNFDGPNKQKPPNKKMQISRALKIDEEEVELSKSKIDNLFQSEQRQQVIIVRQEPEKMEEIKSFLYSKIKDELIEEMKRETKRKEDELNQMIEDEKRRQIEQELERQRIEEERRREEEERRRIAQLQKEKKKISFDVAVDTIQYEEEEAGKYFSQIYRITPEIYNRVFLNESVEENIQFFSGQLYLMFLRGFLEDQQVSSCIVRYDWEYEECRKMVIEYTASSDYMHFIASFHSFSTYLWEHDPVEMIETVIYVRVEDTHEDLLEVLVDIQDYAKRRGVIIEQQQSQQNIKCLKLQWRRPEEHRNIKFPFTHFYHGRKMSLKCEMLTSAFSLTEQEPTLTESRLEFYTSYIFLLIEMFRKYFNPEEVVELREHATNMRRLKDMFKTVHDVEEKDPSVDTYLSFESKNLAELYDQMREKVEKYSERYEWIDYGESENLSNRIIVSMLEFKLQLGYTINSCHLDGRRFLRMNVHENIEVIKSSIYSRENIYLLKTDNPKIKMFFMDAEHYRLLKIQLQIFLNLLFNNVIEESETQVQAIWFPQFAITSETAKSAKRITDFNVKMKRDFLLSEDIYFANHEYIGNGLNFKPEKEDMIFYEALIVGFLHEDVEQASRGLPIYAKMIDEEEMF